MQNPGLPKAPESTLSREAALCLTMLLGFICNTIHAAVVINSGPLNALIPDETASGYASTLEVGSIGAPASVSVSLNLSVPAGETGWLGDLYVYVQHGSDLAVLLNRVGRTAENPTGYDDSQNAALTFTDSAINGDIHQYRLTLAGNSAAPLAGPLTGVWSPDGRNRDPGLVLDTDARSALLGGLALGDAGGSWRLFLADLSGGGQHQLDSWAIRFELASVPEPAGLGGFIAASLLGFATWRRIGRR